MKAGENPFAPGRLERVLGFDPELAGTTWPELEKRWRELGCRAAVAGRRGSGKSALLREWALRHGGVPVLFFNEQRRRLSEDDIVLLEGSAGRLLVIDGDDHLSRHDRQVVRRAAGKAAGVLVARHRAGPWPELGRLCPSVEMAAALLVRAAPAHAARFSPHLPARWRRCRGNLRELWLGFFDELAAENFCKSFTNP